MVDLPLFDGLLAALRPQARLVVLGDPDQLAPVEAGTPFADVCALAEALWRRAVRTNSAHVLMLLGDRGAGKTFQLERAARYLCGRGRAGAAAASRLEQAVLAGASALSALGEAESSAHPSNPPRPTPVPNPAPLTPTYRGA